MEIIIHGKPLAGSAHATKGLDATLSQKIVGEFFEGMSNIREKESLFVDARLWKGIWYSTYTFVLGKNIRDTANRDSYFALSLIIPQKYCCLISQVYSLLKNVIQQSVLNVYLSSSGQYIVQNLDNATSFDRLCDNLSKHYVNLEETFDSSFKAATELRNEAYYNLVDCDSKAFVNLLKARGRIIVTETTVTKDSLAEKTQAYARQVQQLQSEVQAKSVTIDNQVKQIAQLQESIQQANNTANGQVNRLKTNVASLQSENKKLKESQEKFKMSYETLMMELEQMVAKHTSSTSKHSSGHKQESIVRGWSRFLPVINTLLLALLTSFIVFLSLKGCSLNKIAKDPVNEEDVNQAFRSELLDQVKFLKEKSAAQEYEIDSLKDYQKQQTVKELVRFQQEAGQPQVYSSKVEIQKKRSRVSKVPTSETLKEVKMVEKKKR